MTAILIVDDDQNSRSVIHDLLIPENYEITQAASGPAAIDAVRDSSPDVIITDLMMPGMDGIELCRWLRAESRTRGTPIIMVTALDSREDMARALDAGATDFIAKPVSGIEVRSRVRSMIRVARSHRTLEELLALRTDFTNMVIHDLRNPLQVISFSAEILRREHPDPSPPLARIQAQVVRLERLIDDVLVVARSEAGVLTANRAEIDANALLCLVVEDCLPAAGSVDISIVANENAPDPLYVDVALLRRCLENLVLNAIKFSPRKTSIAIEIVQKPEGVRIDVIDEGHGIPEALRQSMFHRFVTGDRTNPNVKQTGLGLAFCQMVAEAHSGTIEALPREGKGSIMRICLPSVIPAAMPSQSPLRGSETRQVS